MFRLFTSRVRAFAVLAGLALAAPALAGPTVPYKEKAGGTINVSEFISDVVVSQEFSGSGNATHMGKYTQTGSHKANLLTGEIFDGEFTSTAADGSTISGIY